MKKYIVITVILMGIISVQAQNKFLNYDFWKKNPSKETIDILIEKGNSLTEKDRHGFDAVSYAILGRTNTKTIKYLIKKGIDVNTITHDERTYIFWAGYRGNLELMKFLLKKGARTDLRDDKGNSLIQFTAMGGTNDTRIFNVCFENGSNSKELTKKGKNLAHIYAQNMSDVKMLDYFAKKGVAIFAVDTNGNGVFNYASKNRDLNVLKQLVAKKIPYNLISKNNENAFYFLTQGKRRGNVKIDLKTVKYFEKLGILPTFITTDNKNALHNLASSSKNTKIINYFIKKGADINLINNQGNTPFMIAAADNTKEVLNILSKGLKNSNHKNKKGHTALTFAIEENTPEIVEYLLKKGADASIKDKKGRNLGYFLVVNFRGKTEDFKRKMVLLQNNGFNIKELDKKGNSLLHYAIKKEKTPLVKELVTLGLDVNVKNKQGITPLHLASMMGKDTKIINYLLSVGADKNSKTNNNETPYQLAVENDVFKTKKIDVSFLK